ncbi:putative DNA-binding transcriptional regulator YafY [Variovorax sp. SG517]|uniref:helix-turn-helix transcriptional regulator n=1 Tax=Variovorax sp. SG517 TaxID=2587117 RepID=UPI00159CFECB|nr:YafY family protein [Variovorax sp. SG517]NVM87579.1 putative DNA-binding transcriptional regulator YafY [Variovorax sp. SG517]
MLSATARLIRLLSLFQAQRSRTGADLAARLEITERTLRRDVDRLRSLGYTVDSTSGVAGGYRLGAGTAMPPLLLEDEEAIAVALGLGNPAGATGDIGNASMRALAKLEQLMPPRLRRRLDSVRASVVPVMHDKSPVRLKAVSFLAEACTERLELRFGYRDHHDAVTKRTAQPHRVVQTGRRWYLLAWDTAREDWRTFRLDRIVDPEPTGERFTPRRLPHGDVASYMEHALKVSPYLHHAQVVVHAPAGALEPYLGWVSGTPQDAGEGATRIATGANSLDALSVWLGCLPYDFEVESPRELVEHLALVASRLARSAGKAAGSPPSSHRKP